LAIKIKGHAYGISDFPRFRRVNRLLHREMIRFKEFINKEKSSKPHFMVVGHPIGHSLSPFMHSIALKTHEINADYLAIDLDPADVGSFISWINRDAFLGSNVTIPYKSQFLEVVDHLDQTAADIGALNTIVKNDNAVTGYNTDVYGFLQPLQKFSDYLNGETVIVFGTGGASKAVIYALKSIGVGQIVVVSRDPGLKNIDDVVMCDYSNWQAYAGESVMIVNTTPLGMYPKTDRSPVGSQDAHLLEGKICYDLVYNPLETSFLKLAKQFNAETIGGLDMFIFQGAKAFELWTGKSFPIKEISDALTQKMQV
jgi:shikimate dehydrogenase